MLTRAQLWLRALVCAVLLGAAVIAGLVLPASATAVTNLNVTNCAASSTALGSALPPFTRVSSSPCNAVFGDTLDIARLFVYQQDGAGQAMPGVPDFSAGGDDWAVGDNAFGACFENHTTNVTEIWVHDLDNACGASNSDAWRSVVATRATGGSAIADTNALGVTTGSVDLRFGLNASTLTSATYSAPLVFEVVAPAVNTAPSAPSLVFPANASIVPATSFAVSATFNDPNPGDTGQISFQLCSDAACGTVVQSGTSVSGLAVGANGSWTATALTRGTTYYWRASSTDAQGATGPYSAIRSFTINSLPTGTPVSPTSAAITTPTPTLTATHSDSDGHTGTLQFEVCSIAMGVGVSCNDAGGTIIAAGQSSSGIASGSNGSWVTPALTRGTTYYWHALSTDSLGESSSAWSTSRSFTINSLPVATLVSPANAAVTTPTPTLTAQSSESDAQAQTLSFQLCSDSSCSTVLQSGSAAATPQGSWTPTALTRGTTYYWRAQSTDTVPEAGAWTATRSFTVNALPTATLASPANAAITTPTPTLSATHTDTNAQTGTISFQLCSDSACSTVVQSGSSAAGVPSGSNGTWAPATLVRGTTYYWRAQSTDTTSESGAWTATRSFTVNTLPVAAQVTPAASAVTTPTPTLTASHTDANTQTGTVSFQLCSDAACNTVVQSGSSAGGIASGANGNWTPTALTRGSTYYWRVQSTDTTPETGAWSATRSLTINTLPVAAQVSPAAAATTSPTPVLTASHTDANGHTGTISFQLCSDSACSTVVQSGSSGAGIASGANASWSPAALTRGATYYWRVQSTDTVPETGAWTATRSLVVNALPVAAHVTPAAAAITTPTPTLTASHSDSNGHTGTISFQLCSDSACATVVQSGSSAAGITSGANGSWTPTALTRGVTYYWRVQSTDTVPETGAWSATRSLVVNTLPTAAPVAPAVSAVTTPAVTLTATHSDANGHTGTLFFQLCSDAACNTPVQSGSSSAGIANGANGSWSPTALTRGVTYYWRVRSTDTIPETGSYSAIRSFTVNRLPSATQVSPAAGATVSATPSLTATHSDPDGHSGMLSFQVCTDAACSSVVRAGTTAAGIASGSNGTWTPAALGSGTYYWRVSSTDLVGETGAWTATSSLVVPAANTAPTATPLSPSGWTGYWGWYSLEARHNDPEGHTGTLEFQFCNDNTACASPGASIFTAGGIPSGSNGSVGPYYLNPNEFWFWRVRSTDSLGATGAWSAIVTFWQDECPGGC